MKDKLKQFINANREDFDNESPGSSLYGRIQGLTELRPARGKFVSMLSRGWAAVAACVIVTGLVFFIRLDPSNKQETVITGQEPEEMNEMIESTDPVYAKQIIQFREIIGLQQEELKHLKKDYPELYIKFSNDISSLDSSYRTLKEQLQVNPNRETLLEAMIQNLQIQSELLARQLLIIRQIKQQNNSHEKTRI